ncbi:MAG: type II toxin-antitoxin system VapC family toxin [Ignavibacteria bacterium]|nr:type II toxin-antitoxin system VapC family toxin [Ignavibacteria bacterium]
MNAVDSSAWLEYFADGPAASFFAPAIENVEELLVPAICIYEVFKRVLQQRGEDDAVQAVSLMQQGTVVDVDAVIAESAARISAAERLPMADSMIVAIARARGAMLWTQDAHFEGMAGVKYRKKK